MSLNVLSLSEFCINQFYFFLTEPKMIGLMFISWYFYYFCDWQLHICWTSAGYANISLVILMRENKAEWLISCCVFFNAEKYWLTTGWPSMVLLMFFDLSQKITTLPSIGIPNPSKQRQILQYVFPVAQNLLYQSKLKQITLLLFWR